MDNQLTMSDWSDQPNYEDHSVLQQYALSDLSNQPKSRKRPEHRFWLFFA